jgi:hypothetical protein
MRNGRPLKAAAPVFAALLLFACQKAPAEEEHAGTEPAKVEPIEGTHLARITLTPRAAQRIDVHTASVVAVGGRTQVLAGAILFDPEGEQWVYTNPEPLVFVRQEVHVDRFAGDVAFLSKGPRVGTNVVTLGAAELYGSESGLGGGEEEEEE